MAEISYRRHRFPPVFELPAIPRPWPSPPRRAGFPISLAKTLSRGRWSGRPRCPLSFRGLHPAKPVDPSARTVLVVRIRFPPAASQAALP